MESMRIPLPEKFNTESCESSDIFAEMRMKFVLIPLLLLAGFLGFGSKEQAESRDLSKFRELEVMFYNVENLFDTLDDPTTIDEEFLPEAKKLWNTERYTAKLDSLAKVIQEGLGSNNGIVGLAEVENRRVLEDLIARPALAFRKFKIVHKESPDARGIDVALLLPHFITADSSYWVNIEFPDDTATKTREILMCRIQLAGHSIWLSVNHFPSRRGGQEASAPKRVYVASKLREQIEHWQEMDANSGFIIMGDFNDEPMDSSINKVLLAGPEKSDLPLVNLFWPLQERGYGSYNYKKDWNMLDQIIVSRNLMDQESNMHIPNGYARIFVAPYVREKEEPYKDSPLRTYAGSKYLGGFSDHFAVITTLRYN